MATANDLKIQGKILKSVTKFKWILLIFKDLEASCFKEEKFFIVSYISGYLSVCICELLISSLKKNPKRCVVILIIKKL